MECPFCSHDNLEGADQCARCEADLTDELAGVASHDIEHNLMHTHLDELLSQDFLTVRSDCPVAEAVRAMVQKGFPCAMVVDDGDICGIFTERDALNKLAVEYARKSAHAVSEFMTANPETLDVDAPVAFALNLMVVGGYRHLPIVRDGKLAGIVSVKHIFAYLSRQFGDVVAQS